MLTKRTDTTAKTVCNEHWFIANFCKQKTTFTMKTSESTLGSGFISDKYSFTQIQNLEIMNIKTIGIVIIVVGALITASTGISFITKKKVLDIGKLEITRDENHFLSWSPLLGLAVMVVGGGVYFYGMRKS
jgi:hypothetical protein